MHKNYN